MPVAKGTKRMAKAQSEVESKKQKVDPNLAGVIDAIGEAKDLPERCRTLLVTVAPQCLETPASERHKHQATVVSWIGDVLDGVRGTLQQAVSEANAEASGADQTKEDLEVHASNAKAALATAKEGVASGEATLAVAVQRMAAAKATLSDAETVQSQAEAKAEELRKDKQALKAVVDQEIQFLKQDAGFEAAQAQQHAARLLPIVEKFGMEESLRLALPKACAKTPSERGQFDTAVLDQVESGIVGKVGELEVALEAGAASAEAHGLALEAARSGLEEAEKGRQAALAELEAAKAGQRQATTALDEAEAAVMAFVRGRAPAEEARNAKVAALQNFTGYNLECFNLLRDKAAPAGA